MYKSAEPPPIPPKPLPWYVIWLTAMNRPSPATYATIIEPHNVSMRRAAAWIGLSAGISYTAASILNTFVVAYLMLGSPGRPQGLSVDYIQLFLLLSVGLGIVWAGLGMLGWYLVSLATTAVARVLGGTGDLPATGFVLASFMAPLAAFSALVSAVPLANMSLILFCLYSMVLAVLAIREVHGLDWPSAATASGPAWIGLFVGVAVYTVALAPSIGIMLFLQPGS
jgi:hypothetical protein